MMNPIIKGILINRREEVKTSLEAVEDNLYRLVREISFLEASKNKLQQELDAVTKELKYDFMSSDL